MTTMADIATFAQAQEVLAAQLPGYTRREKQENLAAAIEQAIADEQNLLAQAGTGIGKSLGALIPAILSGRRTIVATSTKNLQSQYAKKDLPFLEANLPGGVRWAVIKGRSNYVCALRASELETPSAAQERVLDELEAADVGGAGHSGDREDLPQVNDSEWSKLSISAAECPGAKECPFAKEGKCYVENVKEKAADSQVVITNTAYLMQDLRIRDITKSEDGRPAVELLGDYDLLIVDEAHNLQSAATSALSDSIGERALIRLATDIDGYLQRETGEVAASGLHQAVAGLWQDLEYDYAAHVRVLKGKTDPMRLTQAAIISGYRDQITAVTQNLAGLRNLVKDSIPGDKKAKLAKKRLLRRIDDWHARVVYYTLADDSAMARWLEQETSTYRGMPETRLYLRSAPVSVAPFLNDVLWSREHPVIMMSATLAIGGKFDFVREQLGMPEAGQFDAGSPFDYQRQARLYVPEEKVPAPSGATYQSWKAFAQEATARLVKASGGGALLLFTSRSAMNDAHRRLAPQFEAMGLTVLKQGDGPASVVGRAFKEDEDSVLFALRSFFEGFDVQGRSLRLVVLDKLPFAVPTDVLVAARSEAIEKVHGRGSSFGRLSMPEMSLTLIQAVGRLIRHADDKGVMAILDSRLTGKGYGRQILRSLPPVPQTTDIHEAMAFLREG